MEESRNFLSESTGLPVKGPEPGKKTTFFGLLRARFVTGLFVAFPLVVTLFFGRFLFDLIDRWADPISQQLFNRPVPGFGAAIFVIGIFLLGVLAHNVIGRRVLNWGEKGFARIPVLRAVYSGTREVTKAFASNRARSFRRVVLIPFPSGDVWGVAFVTGEFDETTPDGTRRVITVFMPTTPNPTTGFFLVYPATAVKETNLSVEEALRMVISGGLVSTTQERLFPKPPAAGPAP